MPDNMSTVGIMLTTICFLFSLLASGFLFPFWTVVSDRSSLQCMFSSELELSMAV